MVSKNDIIKILDNVTKVLNEQPEKELEEFLKVLQQVPACSKQIYCTTRK